MGRTVGRGWRPGRGPFLGVLLLGGLLTAVSLSDGVRGAPPKGNTPKKPAEPVPPPKLNLTIVAESSDVHEMAKRINDKLAEKWKENKIVPARYVDDYEFIRRASLDIIGRIAKPEEIQQYLRDPVDRRRSRLIERLLAGDEYAQHWANLWTNWLLTRSGPFGRGTYHDQMADWLKEQFRKNRPYNEIVEQLITATGKNTDNGAVNFVLAHVGANVPAAKQGEFGRFEMVPLTARITRLFLGTQIQCAQCHDHPFYGNLKQEDFWGVNAFLRQVERRGNPMPRRNRPPGPLELEDNRNVNHDGVVFFEKRNGGLFPIRARFLASGEEKDGKAAPPARLILGPEAPPRRGQLAQYLIAHDNFPRAVVNRMWGVFFGRGFTNPVDDFNEQNQPSNPELLNELAARLKHYNYDLKKLIRWICNSNAYHLSCAANKTNDKPEHEALFSRMVLKSMSPEQLFESLMVATNAEAGANETARKNLKNQWLNNLIANFGDDEGNEVNFSGTVVQALLMMNGKDINDAITRKNSGTVARALARNPTPRGVVTELYLAALNRPPTSREVFNIVQKFPLRPQFQRHDYQHLAARFEDLFWALLNSNEFILNH